MAAKHLQYAEYVDCHGDDIQTVRSGVTTYYDNQSDIDSHSHSHSDSHSNAVQQGFVGVIVTVRNEGTRIRRCLEGILAQTGFAGFTLVVGLYDDNSSDNTFEIVTDMIPQFSKNGMEILVENSSENRGPGYGRNCMLKKMSKCHFICIQDGDDVMTSNRIARQLQYATVLPRNFLIGCRFVRDPDNSTARYTDWANSITQQQLYHQRYRECTICQPTWFGARDVFVKCWNETWTAVDDKAIQTPEQPTALCNNKGCTGYPEDMEFLLRHVKSGGGLFRVPDILLSYSYHVGSASFFVSRESIRCLQVEYLQDDVMNHLQSFYVWNGGRNGVAFAKSLSQENRDKILGFIDIDEKKIRNGILVGDRRIQAFKPTHLDAPFFTLVTSNSNREGNMPSFEQLLQSVTWAKEGKDFFVLR